MPRGRELNDEERAVIDALHNEGKSSRSIALVLNRDHSGISKYLKKRGEEKKPRPGARRKLNDDQLRLLYRTASNRVISASRLKAELQLNVSTKTILTYLHRNPNIPIDMISEEKSSTSQDDCPVVGALWRGVESGAMLE